MAEMGEGRPGDAETLRGLLAAAATPDCAALTPFLVLDADLDAGWVRLEFAPQPAFRNHGGAVQGGFAVAMLDGVISIAGFARTGAWLPTVEIKTSFLAPLPIGTCIGEGRIFKAGRQLVFAEGRLLSGGRAAVIATATLIRPQDGA
jgi:uncharacterized protein (TIGR00369 family)